MRTLRTFLLLLLCFALPVYGAVSRSVDAPSCGMHDTVDHAAHGAVDAGEDVPDCCEDVDALGDSACKTGLECKSGSYSIAEAGARQAVLPRSRDDAAPRVAPPPLVSAADIWRPPARS